jgi:hypothetical protein
LHSIILLLSGENIVTFGCMVNQPGYTKTILCLANSRRPGGRCVAGKEFENGKAGQWLRPINADNHSAISEVDLRYEGGESADVLDVIAIPMLKSAPHDHHREDHQITPDFYWEKIGRASWQQVVDATDTVKGALWPTGDSSFHGLNDKVAEALAKTQTNSLLLVEPSRLDLVVGSESQYGGGSRRHVRAAFQYNGVPYNFVVTDPWIEDKYFAGQNGTFRIAASRLCISLPEVIGGAATKLVAAVITPDRP